MTYLVVWNGSVQATEKIKAKTWMEFIEQLNRLTVSSYGEPPDLIYLLESRL